MSKLAVIAKLPAQEGKGGELIAAIKDYFPQVHDEPGTEVYAVHQDNSNPDLIWFYELYADMESLAAHGGSDAFKKLGGALGGLLSGAPELIMLTPVEAKGLPL